ncbi:MAG: endolytic transglycosylase MltG [Chloroflexota bacterium]|nr:endolytic transglycosylase MltG [Chloroflexota bacterium]
MRILKLIASVAALLVVLAAIGVLVLLLVSDGRPIDYIQAQIVGFRLSGRDDDLTRAVGSDDTPIRFTVQSGDTPRAIAGNLLAAGLISDADLFVDYARYQRWDTELEAGTYFLNRAQSLSQIAAALTDSRGSVIPFRVIEGTRLEEIAESIDANPLFGFSGADFLRVTDAGALPDPTFAAIVGLPAGASHEGFMFPNTYSLPPAIDAIGLRETLTDEFITQTNDAGVTSAAVAQNWSLFQVATLASIVQREVVRIDEAPKVAGVYLNRLDIGMKLDADPTVQYPLGQPGDWWTQITRADYSDVISPYNTYLNNGLPPGPIANAGLAMLRAVVAPEPSEFFYFQAECSGNGYHRFARTFDEHLANSCF